MLSHALSMLYLCFIYAVSMLYLCSVHPPSIPRLCLGYKAIQKNAAWFLKSLGLMINGERPVSLYPKSVEADYSAVL